MNKLSSILTISQDTRYGEIIKLNYQDRPIKVYYLPSFIGATRIAKAVMPDAFILDFYKEDFISIRTFLEELSGIKKKNPRYAPRFFLSQAASTSMNQALARMLTQPFTEQGQLQQEKHVTLTLFQAEVLVAQLDLAINATEQS